MRDRAKWGLSLSIVLAVFVRPPVAEGREGPAKKVLVELYTSQGCDSCPPASDLLGRLASLGYGPDQIVALNFHVDYFNKPWVDPFSDPSFSLRQREYNEVLRRNDLYFTPLLMVDGREPLLGSDRPKVLSALRHAGKEAPGVALDLDLAVTPTGKTLSVKIAARDAEVAGRDLLIGVALTEDRVTTRVLSGENAGRTLVEHHVVRRFDRKFLALEKTASRTLAFPLELAPDWDPARFQVTVFAQDRATGKVYQAESTPWNRAQAPGPSAERARDLERLIARRKARRAATNPPLTAGLSGFDPLTATMGLPDSFVSDDTALCPACGSFFSRYSLPPIILRPGQSFSIPSAIC